MNKEHDNINVSKSVFKQWLEKLQQESWQLELLISGFALFAIWEARVLVDGVQNYYDLYRGDGGIVNLALFFMSWLLGVSWRIFFFNLLIHVVVRGLWIGAIGLRYVSSDINYENLNYADKFTTFLKSRIGEFDDYIAKLERFASVLFAYTFLLFFIFLSLIIYFLQLALISIFFKNPQTVGLATALYVALAFIPFIDFVTMGGIKRIKEKNISSTYFVLYRLFGILTLSFLYRPLLYNFWDEKYTRRLFLISIPYVILLTLLPLVTTDATPFFPVHDHGEVYFSEATESLVIRSDYYDDERTIIQEQQRGIFNPKFAIRAISLPSLEVTSNQTWLFLKSYPSDNEWLKKKITPFKKSGITFEGINDRQTDTLYEAIKKQQASAMADVIRNRRAITKQLEEEQINRIQPGVIQQGGKLKLDSLYWQNKRDSTDRYWDQRKIKYTKNRLNKITNSLLEVSKLTIDGIPYNDSCTCKFYIHPNIGEKGLRCYFPVESLENGFHTIHLKRKFYDEEEDDFRTRNYYVPFLKNENKN